ncbi:MAG: hypothetical protein SV375_00815 [Thermodesulfobacteriota bacterium]|nr:hypothetical protein [Thermodesulfobacteriota bacterium]
MKKVSLLLFTMFLTMSFALGPAWSYGISPLFREGVINGIPYATGGVGVKERELMEDLAKTKDFNLKVVLASISGSYLSDLMVYIEDMSGKMVFETVTDGPWLYVDLPLGKHTK